MRTGYLHPLYAKSLSEFGEPQELPNSGGWLLKRSIPGCSEPDAMGCYPIFSCQNWQHLPEDLNVLESRFVSLSLVADPFGDYLPENLSAWFNQVVAFKQHHVLDFSMPVSISKHHAYYGRKAAGTVDIEVGPAPEGFAEEWAALYSNLVEKHQLKGIKAFSNASFELQMKVPGMVVFRAIKDGVLVGAHLWYEQKGIAYSHLAATTDVGYGLNCSYAIYAAAIEYFRNRVGFINFGAGAGVGLNRKEDGLGWFKAGWANSSRTAYFCGRILNAAQYTILARGSQDRDSGYFPVYRSGELA